MAAPRAPFRGFDVTVPALLWLVAGWPALYTPFGVVLLPVFLAALAVAGARHVHEPGGAVALLVLAIVVPPMVATCLTDGQERNRMRFATTPILVIGLCRLVGLIRRRPAVRGAR